jgi:hypothetical protein
MSAISTLSQGLDSAPSAGTTTPITWTVGQVSPTLVVWRDTTSGIFEFHRTYSIGWRLPTKSSKVYRTTVKFVTPLDRPVVDSGSNTTHVLAGSIQANIEVITPTTATAAERVTFHRALIQLLLQTYTLQSMQNSDYPY